MLRPSKNGIRNDSKSSSPESQSRAPLCVSVNRFLFFFLNICFMKTKFPLKSKTALPMVCHLTSCSGVACVVLGVGIVVAVVGGAIVGVSVTG